MAAISAEQPQVVGESDAVTLPSMQKAARDLSSRRVPLVGAPLVLGSAAFCWCRARGLSCSKEWALGVWSSIV